MISGRPGPGGPGRRALVTGASSGIGASLAAVLAGERFDLVLVARRADRLEALKAQLEQRTDVTVSVLVEDLADPAAPQRIAAELERGDQHIDFLVNSAGYSQMGAFADIGWAQHARFLQVMGIAPLELTRRLIPAMIARRWGRIVNVSSIGALMVGSPNAALYAAVKSMLLKFSEALAAENAEYGVHCTASLPGLTKTAIFEASGLVGNVESSRLMRLAMMSPDVVARQAYDAVMAGRSMVIHGYRNRIWAGALQHSPAPTQRWLATYISNLEVEALHA